MMKTTIKLMAFFVVLPSFVMHRPFPSFLLHSLSSEQLAVLSCAQETLNPLFLFFVMITSQTTNNMEKSCSNVTLPLSASRFRLAENSRSDHCMVSPWSSIFACNLAGTTFMPVHRRMTTALSAP
eukprot:TRINITY_DN286_c0_g2_i2.p3 TRINITY_DN286_c0_g2~~TRINITY_DN286_c0_g2_i2.p3  ORF type:complete len:125 (-),score=7.94 TRINITY_DN286_c0_g2_i2:433-807(-)